MKQMLLYSSYPYENLDGEISVSIPILYLSYAVTNTNKGT